MSSYICYTESGETHCPQCGRELPRDLLRRCPESGITPTDQPDLSAPLLDRDRSVPPGLGDYTEQLLTSIGVTKDRYVAAKQLFGLPPTCGCDARKEWLNRVSDWWRGGPK